MDGATGTTLGPSPTTDPVRALDALLKSNLLPLCIIHDGRLTCCNTAFSAMFSLEEAAAGARFTSLVVERDRAAVEERLAAILSGAPPSARFAFHGLLPDGTECDVEFLGTLASMAEGPSIAGLVVDITERQRAQATLSSLAFADALTGLPNRAQFLDQLRLALASAQAADTSFAVLVGDLDGFKDVNDRHGHEAGDVVLQTVARRLRNAARSNDTVARLGGDEFAMILPSISTPQHAALVAGRVVRSIGLPIGIGGDSVAVGISVGVALYPAHGDGMDQLVRAADSAMYVAKRSGKNCYGVATLEHGNGNAAPLRFVDWSEAVSVGVSEIDDQHRRIIELINALGDDLKTIKPHDRVAATMNELMAYARAHFETEERLLEVHAPDQFEQHRAAHRRLLEDLRSLASGVDEQSMALTMRYLQDWLFDHIETADRPLGEALNTRGLR